MANPLQPKFKIRVANGHRVPLDTLKSTKVSQSVDGTYIDVEYCAAFPVIYEEQASLLNTLKFTIDKYADLLLPYFAIGQAVTLYGGYYDERGDGMRQVFIGTVTRIKTAFSNSGKVSFTVDCMNYGYTKLGKDFKTFVYPDKSGRQFAQADKLKLEDIIIGIAKENNFEIGDINLSASAKAMTFDKYNIRYQKNVSDWKFLVTLAQDFGCSVWVSTENNIDRLNFMSNEKAFRRQDDIAFVYPMYGVKKSILDDEVQKFDNPSYNRPRILRDLTVDEDISMAYAVSRTAMYFDKETGEYKESVSRIDDKNGNLIFYELDEQRVEYVSQTMPGLAEKIRESGPTSMEWGTPDNPECASYYYKVVQVFNEQTAVFDKAFFGITIEAKCNQDLDIHSQRTYKVRGILSYHSRNLESSFFLRGLKHTWYADGTWTELDFIR